LKQLIRRNWRAIFIFITIVIDALAIGISGLVAYFLREYLFNLSPVRGVHLFGVVLYSGTVLIGFALVLGLYRASFHTDVLGKYTLAMRAYFFSVPVVVSSFYFLKLYQLPRIFTTLFFISVPVMHGLGRVLLRKFELVMRNRGFGIERTLLIDQGEGGPFIFRKYDLMPELGYNIVGVALWNGTPMKKHEYMSIEVTHCDTAEDLKRIVQKKSIDRVVIATVEMRAERLTEIIQACRESGAKLRVLSQESEELLRFSHVRDLAGITLYSMPRKKIEKTKRAVKRAFDIMAAVLALVVISPIFVITSLAIYIESGMPILFKQRRAAIKGGKTFNFYKFRSMVKNADAMKESLFEMNESDGALFKIKNDSRMTKVGKIIRKFSIDELPQLVNVIKGEMSIVGPRPLPAEDLKKVEETKDFWKSIKDREKVKPGITGLWQISGRSNIGFREMIWLDLYYIENQSLLFDLEILFETVPVVLFGKGAY
jgi:exopolysaccharide biosynthesis polyprenyl glycosylphosphotransferase